MSEEADGRLTLTATGVPLRSDVPGSLRDTLRFVVGPWLWRSWGDLLYSVKTGEPAFDRLWGMSNFDYWRENPEVGELQTARLDLAMLLQTQGGRERTQSEYAQLLGGVGLELEEAVPTASPFSILVFRNG